MAGIVADQPPISSFKRGKRNRAKGGSLERNCEFWHPPAKSPAARPRAGAAPRVSLYVSPVLTVSKYDSRRQSQLRKRSPPWVGSPTEVFQSRASVPVSVCPG